MRHTYSNKGTTFIHSVYGSMYEVDLPIINIIEVLNEGGGEIKTIRGNKVFIGYDDIDLVFNNELIWYNFFNEEMLVKFGGALFDNGLR